MRTTILLFIIFTMFAALSAGIGYAQLSEYSAVYDIQPDLSVKESIYVSFGNQINQATIDYIIDKPVSDIYASDGNAELNTETLQLNGRYILRIHTAKPVVNIFISFRIDDYIYSSGSDFVFFAEQGVESETQNASISLILPESYGIVNDQISPKTAEISSDGRRITIRWNFQKNSFSVSARFESLNKEFNVFIPAAIILAIIIALVYIKLSKKAKSDFYKGFSEDELKTIHYLEKNPQTYQNKIEQEFKFSRAKMTRIMQKLEAKDLVEKKRKGRTNRLVWKI